MPAAIDDPAGPAINRVSGQLPFPDPSNPALPPDILPRQVTLRDRQTFATIVPFASRHQIPASLIVYLCTQINKEIEGGDTYPFLDAFSPDGFADYWFQDFGAVMLLGNIESADHVVDGKDWARECLGSFYIKPNYPGRSSHVCNGGLLVTDESRNRGAGRLMGETYIDWAPRLGYTYSVFNLVYETNVASCKIWDALGFKRIGRVKGCGNLKSYPDRLIDAIIYGRDLVPGESEELVSEERFDKIKFYLKYGKYPNGADRAEKSRLRSAATHYKLLDGDKLMLKDKEVISDPARQYEIARNVHVIHHGGINKTTATIAEKYHWSRIKETVSDVIRTCTECKELGKTPNPGGSRRAVSTPSSVVTPTSNILSNQPAQLEHPTPVPAPAPHPPVTHVGAAGRILAMQGRDTMLSDLSPSHSPSSDAFANPSDIVIPMSSAHALHAAQADHGLHVVPQLHQTHHHGAPHHHPHQPLLQHHAHHHNPMLQDQPDHDASVYHQPIDPQIINHPHPHSHSHPHHHNHHHNHHSPHHHHAAPPSSHEISFEHYHAHADFQALLSATEDVPYKQEGDVAISSVDRDLDMLIEHDAVADDVGPPSGADDMDGLGDTHRDRRAAQRDSVLYDVGFGS
ncbi:Protein SPT10 [Escovopsis weberi]|uniref:Protein SPT10 n=1 Tax=Escovopsis weberi TaxID=150374 RepID=A0A0M8MZJ9_ESCWE|nr:Protein SPT10 [Escovopsis weberi]